MVCASAGRAVVVVAAAAVVVWAGSAFGRGCVLGVGAAVVVLFGLVAVPFQLGVCFGRSAGVPDLRRGGCFCGSGCLLFGWARWRGSAGVRRCSDLGAASLRGAAARRFNCVLRAAAAGVVSLPCRGSWRAFSCVLVRLGRLRLPFLVWVLRWQISPPVLPFSGWCVPPS